ncbi:autoinducer binding domain-containing protein [Aquabacterium sp. J223]|uniref:helix-turn-helix transcriptional regulator n=1 Tax=Aquabacterium sp. J223 TaxID=2898431 RepID=UPI0021AD6F20|nr:autoinducer binding domain-containing protein [Aquabacterium sp. J223]UUX95365.1 autoinducer binding domain-containing protein [Aquabacterium sp. J223]
MAADCFAEKASVTALVDFTGRADYLSVAGDVIRRVPEAVDETQALALLCEATDRLGADASAFVSFIRDDVSHESYRFLLACDPTWCLEYERRCWYANDPWLAYALRHSEPARASEIPITSRQQRDAVELAMQYGFQSAAIIPAPSSGGLSRLGVLCLGSATAGFYEGDGFTIFKLAARPLAMELHEWWIARIRAELVATTRVTAEDVLLLRLERQGRSTKHIAAELDMSTSAVDSRFQRLNVKLGVPNRRSAAALAAEYGLI